MRVKTNSIIILLLLLNSILFSQRKVYTFDDLVNSSNLIVRGKVNAVYTYEIRKGVLLSDINFRVTKVYKGNEKISSDLIFQVFGGTKNGITTTIIEDAQFELNEESILFLKDNNQRNSIQKYFIIGLSQGKFNILFEKGTEVITRDKYESNRLSFFQDNLEKIVTNKISIRLTEFENYIKEKSK
jgi:hypothetical protein